MDYKYTCKKKKESCSPLTNHAVGKHLMRDPI